MSMKVSIGKISKFEAGRLTKVDANGISVVVTIIDDRLCAVRNRCTHFPVALDGGKIEDGNIVCPNHGSKFNMCTGEVVAWVSTLEEGTVPKWLAGLVKRKPKNIQAYKVFTEGDEAFIEI